jgi:hypothetical protein
VVGNTKEQVAKKIMLTLLLALALTAPALPIMDHCEINQTPRDPELADRDALSEDQRRGYLLDCE